MATSYAQGVGTPLCTGRGGPLLGSRSWLDPTRPFLYPAYMACRRSRERRGKVHMDLGPQRRQSALSFNFTDVKEGAHVWDRRDSLRLRCWSGPRDSQSDLVDGQLDGVVREGRFVDSTRAKGKLPLWKSMLGVTIGVALCTTMHAGQAQALATDQVEFATETTSDRHSAQQIIAPDLRDITSEGDVSQVTSPFERTIALDSPEMKGDSISGFTSPELKEEGVNPILNVSLETTSSKKLEGETEPAPAERKRRTSNGLAAAAAAVAGVSLVAAGGSSAAAGGTTSAVAAAALTSAASAGGIAALPVSHAVAAAAGLHVAEAVGATVAASNVAASTVAAVGATAGVAAGLTTAAAGAAAAAGAGATSATAGAVAASVSAAAAGTASAATGLTAIAAAGTTSAVAGASSAVAGATSAVAGATSAVVGATSAAAGTTSAAVAAALPLAAASSAVPSTAVLATSLPAAVASKAAIASSAGAISSAVASAVPAVVAKSGATAAATSAGAALKSAVTSAAASSAAAGGAVSSAVTSAAGAGGALSSAVTSAGAVCTTPVRAVAHAAASAALEGGAAVVTAAETAAAAHSAAALTQSGLASAIASSAHHFVEGGVAGAVGATVVCPIDVVKTRMQGQETKKGEKPKYANPADCVVQILKEEGPGGFFLGLIPQLLGVAPEKAMKLTVNDLLMSILEGYIPGARLWTLEVFAGSGGGLAQVVFTNPMEMVKIRQQMQGPAEEGHEKKSALQIARELGPKGLYQGSVATLLREIPSSAIFFGCYIVLKDSFPDQPFVAGCLAAAPSAFLCTPMDVVKTRMQMERKEGDVPLGFLDTMRKIIREEGPKALFNGGLTRVLRVSPQFGITLAVYEILNHW